MFKKPVWDDLSFVTCCIILLEVAIRRWVNCSHKGMDMVSNNTQVDCGSLNDAQFLLSVPRKYPPHHYTTTTSLNRWDKAGWIHAFMFFTPNYHPTIWTIRPGNIFPIYYCPILVILCELYPPCAVLIWQERHPVWSSAAVASSASGFDVLCIQRWYSAYLGCNEWIFELNTRTFDIKAFSSTQLPLTGYFLLFRPFSVNPRDGCEWKSQ